MKLKPHSYCLRKHLTRKDAIRLLSTAITKLNIYKENATSNERWYEGNINALHLVLAALEKKELIGDAFYHAGKEEGLL